jgi:hypothetical protein
MDATDKLVQALNAAFVLDPNAMHALITNRFPCNFGFAEKSFLFCDKSIVLEGEHWRTGAWGLLCGALSAMGLPAVEARWSEDADDDGRRKLIGFVRVAE